LGSLLLFIGRKCSKWIYYLGEGKNITTPWETKSLTSQNNLMNFNKFVEHILIKKGINIPGRTSIDANKILEQNETIQNSVIDTLQEKERLMNLLNLHL
jgi:hypothetical protein